MSEPSMPPSSSFLSAPFESFKSLTPKAQQRILFYSFTVGILSLMGVVVWMTVIVPEEMAKQNVSVEKPVATGINRLNPQELWVEKVTTKMDSLDKQMAMIEEMLKSMALQKEQWKKENVSNTSSSEEMKEPSFSAANNTTSTELQSNILSTDKREGGPVQLLTEGLKQASLQNQPETIHLPFNKGELNKEAEPHMNGNSLPSEGKVGKGRRFRSKGIAHVKANLLNGKKNLTTADNTITPGSFAPAILLSAVNASTGVNNTSNPTPAVIEIVDSGSMGRGFRSDLNGCRVTVACTGDLSSERVHMRLEKMTCFERSTGEAVVVQVDGYVTSEDGVEGIRGTLVDRAGPQIRAAAAAGFLGSMGEFISGAAQPQSVLSLQTGLSQTVPLSAQQVLKQSGAKGTKNAMDRYADFWIKRAEQLQPIIQIQPGRMIDVHFTNEVSLDKSMARNAISRTNDRRRLQSLSTEGVSPQIDTHQAQQTGDGR
jgi:hypothetical protein